MARDRQRAKKRRQRRQQSSRQTTPPGSRTESDAAAQPSGSPDPLQDISGDAELAKLAETGARPVPDLDLEQGEGDLAADEYPQRDETEGIPGAGGDDALDDSDAFGNELPAAGSRTPKRGREVSGGELPKEGNRVVNFIRACIAELRRVQWPNRQQVGQATGVVVGFVIIAGAYLGLLDAAFSRLVSAIL